MHLHADAEMLFRILIANITAAPLLEELGERGTIGMELEERRNAKILVDLHPLQEKPEAQ